MYIMWLVLGVCVRVGLDIFTDADKHRGYINRFFAKLLCLKTNHLMGFPVAILPFWFIWSVVAYRMLHLSNRSYFPLVWGPYIIIVLDDYINRDDDFHKKIRKAMNKIKWKMTQPKFIARPQ